MCEMMGMGQMINRAYTSFLLELFNYETPSITQWACLHVNCNCQP